MTSLLTSLLKPKTSDAALPWITGRYYDIASRWAAAGATLATFANNLYGVLISIPPGAGVDQIAINITIAGTGNARVGLFRLGTDGLPGALLLDGGDIDISGTGIKTATISYRSPGEIVVAAILPSSNVTVTSMSMNHSPLGYADGATTGRYGAWNRTQAYGALPATFGGSLSYQLNNAPALRLRAA